MIAVAAALWVTYLMPTWSRRRQYLATERNAVRLQQTLRILAETAEVPQQVRLEANARTVAAQQKLLAQAEQEERVEAQAEAKAEADAATHARRAAAAIAAASRPPVAASPAARLRRLRKARGLSSLLLLAGLVSAGAGGVIAVLSGSWTVLGAGAVAVVAGLAALSRLARAARASRVVVVAAAEASVYGQRFEPVQLEQTPAPPPTWTPQPLPRPLYLSRGSIAQTAMASVAAAAELRKALAEAELTRRAAQLAPDVTPITRPAARVEAQPDAQSRFAAMGIVGETEPGMTDLDAVLRRRRAVG